MSSLAGQVAETRASATRWLQTNSSLNDRARNALTELIPALLNRLQESGASTLAIGGPPGSGKSTLARLLAELLTASGKVTTVLSLDNYYYGHGKRMQLAHDLHPLLQMRGVPGTHDWEALIHDFDCLRSGRIRGLHLPIFNKSTDDLEPRSGWLPVSVTPDFLIVEGWCIGAPAQTERDLEFAVNELERKQDPLAAWRQYVNHQVALYRAGLSQRVEQFWYLEVPDWDCIVDWRWQQEQELRQPLLTSREETGKFLATYERIVRHMLATSWQWADYRLQADRSHCLRAMVT